ncbi:uncharacterized protein HD556DRAFT_1309356 [Suillus plorans]|uniref:Uncharacterized protein n=1 Tax=Suillus plorans TaxID=116603 RepID=A0A9P7AMH6_9AGAM|nr:uncharacterized protein HD556DRAFT_1309356 [Suillus plorans]KAG1792279.1 hypothetical protein HD556DRAFT_1309356 [Suillus plorans]
MYRTLDDVTRLLVLSVIHVCHVGKKAVPEEDSEDDRGRQLERGKRARPRAMSTRSQSSTPKAKRQGAKSKAIITSNDDMELDDAAVAAPEPAPAPVKVTYQRCPQADKGICSNPVSATEPSYVEIDELDEEQLIVGPAPKMGAPYVEIPPAPKDCGKAANPVSGLQEDDYANSTSPVWSPGCSSCVQRQLICCQGYNTSHDPLTVCARCHRTKHKCGGKGSATPATSRRPAANHTRSKSRCKASTVNVTTVPDDQAASSGDVAATTTTVLSPTAAPATAHVPAPDSQTVLALKEDLAVLQTMVASLVDRVSTGEQLLQEVNWHLAEQEANAQLLADQVAALQRELNSDAESTAAEILPVVIRTDAAETLAAAATALPEDESPLNSGDSAIDAVAFRTLLHVLPPVIIKSTATMLAYPLLNIAAAWYITSPGPNIAALLQHPVQQLVFLAIMNVPDNQMRHTCAA